MSESYIKKSVVKDVLESAYYGEATLGELLERIDDVEPEKVKPMVKGEWEIIPTDEDGNPLKNSDNEIYFSCSVCKKSVWERRTPNFCPNCGADMRHQNE